jgi:archaellin
MRLELRFIVLALLLVPVLTFAQRDTTAPPTPAVTTPAIPTPADSALRIINLSPYFTIHVDSTLNYNLQINKDSSKYYWYLRNSPVGLRINKDNGQLTFKAEKSFFLSGKLKYDVNYKVDVGVQNLRDAKERIDTFFTIVFYNTDIVQSKVKPSVSNALTVDEGDTVSFKIQCENGSFPIEGISFYANIPLKGYTQVKKCDDDFTWTPGFDFVKETDSAKVKILILSFVGVNKFQIRDTATVKIIVRDALNYPLALREYDQMVRNVNGYTLRLKYTFQQLDKGVKRTKSTRTSFDITSSSTALTGSVLASSVNSGTKQVGAILPSVGVTLVPVKEAVAPQKITEQNQASLIRSSIKRLDFMLQDNALSGERDPDIAKKTAKLKDELKQVQVQLIDIPLEMTSNMTEEQLNNYFNSPKVNKKYRTKK